MIRFDTLTTYLIVFFVVLEFFGGILVYTNMDRPNKIDKIKKDKYLIFLMGATPFFLIYIILRKYFSVTLPWMQLSWTLISFTTVSVLSGIGLFVITKNLILSKKPFPRAKTFQIPTSPLNKKKSNNHLAQSQNPIGTMVFLTK